MADPFLEGLIGGLQQRQQQAELLQRQRQFEFSSNIQSLNTLLRAMELQSKQRQQTLTEQRRPFEQGMKSLEVARKLFESGVETPGVTIPDDPTVAGEQGFTFQFPTQAQRRETEIELEKEKAKATAAATALGKFSGNLENLALIEKIDPNITKALRNRPDFLASLAGITVKDPNFVTAGIMALHPDDPIAQFEELKKFRKEVGASTAPRITVGMLDRLDRDVAKGQLSVAMELSGMDEPTLRANPLQAQTNITEAILAGAKVRGKKITDKDEASTLSANIIKEALGIRAQFPPQRGGAVDPLVEAQTRKRQRRAQELQQQIQQATSLEERARLQQELEKLLNQ